MMRVVYSPTPFINLCTSAVDFIGGLSHCTVAANSVGYIPMSRTIANILEQHLLEWMTIPGVLGAAEGVHRGKPCIVILVQKKTRDLAQRFPETMEGVRVVLKEVG